MAQTPIEPRHAARLLDTRTMEDRLFVDLPDMLDPGDLVVVNSTRVRPARLLGEKETGGAAELLLLERLDKHRWKSLVKPARRIRTGTRLLFGDDVAEVETDPVDGEVVVRFDGDAEEVAARCGVMPLPPYIRRPLTESERYQTVYAQRVGSAAAPTAGLHFTKTVLEALSERKIAVASIDLEVGLDTFRPITADSLDDHVMHSEWLEVPEATAAAILQARERGSRVVAIGTTVARTLESAWTGESFRTGRWATDLFIRPGYTFQVVDGLVTNFHVPGSTLVVMIAALLGEGWRQVYAVALERGYRFLSFGDACYIERKS